MSYINELSTWAKANPRIASFFGVTVIGSAIMLAVTVLNRATDIVNNAIENHYSVEVTPNLIKISPTDTPRINPCSKD